MRLLASNLPASHLLVSMLLVLGLAGCAGNKNTQKSVATAPQATTVKTATPEADAAANPYTKSYLPLDRVAVPQQPDPTGPKLFRGNNKDTDNNRMLVKGFDMLGYSSFEAREVPPEQALEQARKLKADLVLLYTKESANKTPASVRIQQLKDQQQARAAGDKSVPPLDDGQAYSYYASFWVKIAPPVIGVHVKGTAKDAVVEGLSVLAVVEESPAFKAGLQEGDTLTRIGEVDLTNTQSLAKVVQRYEGKPVDVEYIREGKANKTSMTLNTRQK